MDFVVGEVLCARRIHGCDNQRSSQICDNQESLVKNTELPVFDGFMPYGWIFRVERVFRAVQYS